MSKGPYPSTVYCLRRSIMDGAVSKASMSGRDGAHHKQIKVSQMVYARKCHSDVTLCGNHMLNDDSVSWLPSDEHSFRSADVCVFRAFEACQCQ